MSEQAGPNLYTIPAGVPFARALAARLLHEAGGKPEILSRMRLLLPTRRACRTVREAFLQEGEGHPLLLPHLQPIGDVDEEELTLLGRDTGLDESAFPPGLAPLRRQVLLARAIMGQPDFTQSPDHALALAGELGRLMDRIYTEDLNLADLPALVTGEFASHWEVTLDFLATLSVTWPEILQTLGMIDSADRRNRLIKALAEHWEKQPPQTPVIAAGSTGSIPATARLLKVISTLPQGRVVLPGLDQKMDDASWEVLDDNHPQATLKQLLGALEVERTSVRIWPGGSGPVIDRGRLVAELMRPAETTGAWAGLKESGGLQRALENITRYDCDTPQEEARVIALLMRETLESPGRTAALVTPDRGLARRVATVCRRWGIEIDDTAGAPLPETVAGSFLRLSARACLDHMAPAALLALLRHTLCRMGLDKGKMSEAVNRLEIAALRGPKPPPGLQGIANRAAEEKASPQAMDLLETLGEITAPFGALQDSGKQPFLKWLDTHIAMAESLAATPSEDGSSRVWKGEDGEAAALFLAELRDHGAALPPVTGEDYLAILEQLMRTVTVRPAYGTHPRLAIFGQLEARLIKADIVILGGLNEGSWPPDPGHDPWMSRPMMASFGLPSPERKIGLAAHDFVQGFSAANVVLTRALRADGTPTVPARWLQRLETVMEAAGSKPEMLLAAGYKTLALARSMDHSSEVLPCERPAPKPPVALRPRKLSVTKIETWMQDPYSIYARYVLGLKALDPVEKPPGAADRGDLIHKVMERFLKASKDSLPADARAILLDIGHDQLSRRADDPGFWEFWWPRFERLADWIVDHEKTWRQQARPVASEVKGTMTMPGPAGDFTLSVRADRIDRLADGRFALIDYKSGGTYSPKKMMEGENPQLPLEALIIQAGGFDNVAAGDVGYLGYWVITGGKEAGKPVFIDQGLEDVTLIVREGLERLIAHFDQPDSAYFSLPDPDRAPRFNDYEHLARIQEWTALDEAEASYDA